MKLTEHFTFEEMCRSEAAARHGVDNTCPDELLPNMKRVAEALEKIRDYYDRPIHITSCYRSPKVNSLVGGSQTSAHKLALAADFEIQGISNFMVCETIPHILKEYDQIIYEFGERGWVHLGFSNICRKQRLSAIKVDGTTKYLSGFIV